MTKNFSKKNIILFTIALVGLFVFIFQYMNITHKAGLKLHLSKSQIEDIANKYVTKLGYKVSGYSQKTQLNQDKDQIKYLTKQYSIKKATAIMREEIPAFYWRISWNKPKDILEEIRDGKKDDNTVTISSDDGNHQLNDLKITLTTKGNLLDFKVITDNIHPTDSISATEAHQIAQDFFQTLDEEFFDVNNFKTTFNDSNYIFKWKNDSLLVGEKASIEIQVKNSKIISFKKHFIIPQEILNIPSHTKFIHIPAILVFLLFFIVILVVLIQKLRKDQVGIKSGLGLAIFVGIAFIVNFLLSHYDESFIEILIPLLIVPIFLIIALLAIISAGESFNREVWPDKVRSFDALNRLKLINPLMSKSIFQGMILAFIALGSYTLIFKFSFLSENSYISIQDKDIASCTVALPIIYLIFSALMTANFNEFVFRVFSVSFLRKKLNKESLILIISALLWSFNFTSNSNSFAIPIYLHIINNFVIGLLFSYFFIKYDIMTVLIGGFVFNIFHEAYPMLFYDNSFMMWNGISLILIIIILVVVAIIGSKRKFDEKQLTRYIPPYVERMQERERMERELEIARKVQLSFLPKKIPQVPKLNIATVCIPATEVGGDYYDFINLGGGKLGVVIGDVSGKGISAAFHMTLTKGFLKSQAKDALSPKKVLIRLNELFYENVERGTFISMIYGIFDINKKTFTFARAGHNPIIIRSSAFDNIEDLYPKGIALGLEQGQIFNSIIEEQKIGIRTGDIFIFYTDGVSEAMNNEKSEFGEKRLQMILQNHAHVLADDLIKIIKNKIKDFVGNTPQHDDLTMIIIKIT